MDNSALTQLIQREIHGLPGLSTSCIRTTPVLPELVLGIEQMTTVDEFELRAKSLQIARELGYVVNEHLPLLDYTRIVRTVDETVDRLVGMYCVAAVAYGFNRQLALDWLSSNAKGDSLTPDERKFLETGKGSAQDYKFQVEGIWALYWACGRVESEFSFATQCPQDFATRLPDLKSNEDARQLRAEAVLRDVLPVVQMADTAYCIHWAYKQSLISGQCNHKGMHEYVVRERRHALGWLLEDEDWDNVSLDT